MKRNFSTILVLIAVVAVIAAPAIAGEEGHSPEAAMMKAMTPGEHHGHMKALEGQFTYAAKAWMDPSQTEPTTWSGNRSAKMILGGRYLSESVDGNAMGMPFEGMGLLAYDNMADEYIYTWIDNMSTTVTQCRGACSEAGWVFTGTHFDPATGKMSDFKNVVKPLNDDSFVFEWYEGEFKMMEITYTRKSS